MEPFKLEETQFLQLKNWKRFSNNLVAGFTTKNGGVSTGYYSSLNGGLHVGDVQEDVIQNRRIISKLTGFPLQNWVVGEQIHDSKISFVTQVDKGNGATSIGTSLPGIDGMITKEKNILLTAFFADCIPLFYLDPVEEIIGIAHAGWQGTTREIAGEMVNHFINNGSQIENIRVTIGPGISKEVYEINNQVASKIDGKYKDKVLIPQRNMHYLLDLKELNSEILLQYGILSHNIDRTTYCTFQDNELFFSHRREQGKTGRMLGFIGMRN